MTVPEKTVINKQGSLTPMSLKLLKAFTIITCCGACIYQLYALLTNILEGDQWTTSLKVETLMSIDFPTISICNLNRVNITRAVELDITDLSLSRYVEKGNYTTLYNQVITDFDYMNLTDVFFATLFSTTDVSYFIDTNSMSDLLRSVPMRQLGRILYNEYKADHRNVEIRSLLQDLAHQCGETIVHCAFEGHILDCCNGSQIFFNGLTSCFTINTSKDQRRLGIGGMSLLLHVNTKDHMGTAVNNFLEKGFHVYVGYHESEASNRAPLAIPTGLHTYIQMEKTKEITEQNSFPFTESLCSDREWLDLLNMSYSSAMCRNQCYLQIVLQVCGCIPALAPGFMGNRCEIDEHMDCIDTHVEKLWKEKFQRKFEECHKQCKPSCNQEYVTTSVSMTRFPVESTWTQANAFMVKRLKETPRNIQYAENNYALVDVFFGRLNQKVIRQSPKTNIFEVIGSIGGLAGLWLGFSMLTLYKIVENPINWLTKRKETRRKPSKPDANGKHDEKQEPVLAF